MYEYDTTARAVLAPRRVKVWRRETFYDVSRHFMMPNGLHESRPTDTEISRRLKFYEPKYIPEKRKSVDAHRRSWNRSWGFTFLSSR